VFCPKCKTDNARRSHRQGLTERLASLFAIYPYRCQQCAQRFLRFRYASAGAASIPTPAEREIKSTRAALSWQGTRREVFLYGGGLILIIAFLYFITRERSGSDGG
jgi:hypothetical protein